jgi:hypothetical protein
MGRVVNALLEQWNENSPLLGAAADGGAKGGCLTPVAMYVHERPHYFREVVKALKRVVGIGNVCVLVVSLDSIQQEMIDIVLAVDFAPVRVLFHPVRDDLLKVQPVVAIKQHWMWLQDQIWTRVPETKDLTGDVALLEEDHIVTPDYLQVLTRLIQLRRGNCSACWGVTVRWACMHDDDKDVRKVCRSHSVINTGIAFDRSTYEAIKASDFEAFSDGWDWSLFHLAQTGQMGDMMLGPAVSRIANIGRLGATVTEHGDAHLQQQLDYNNIGDGGLSVPADSLWIHSEEQRQYTPPSWEPLYVGGIGFVSSPG